METGINRPQAQQGDRTESPARLIGPEVCLEAQATPEASIVPATPVDALSPETGGWEGNQLGTS